MIIAVAYASLVFSFYSPAGGQVLALCGDLQCPRVPQCGDGADNDGDGVVDLADEGCDDLSDDDETNGNRNAGELSFVEVSVDVPPNNVGAFGIAGADWNGNGMGEVVANYHNDDPVVTRWEWNGDRLTHAGDDLVVQRCNLRLYAFDMTLDGKPDLHCEYTNDPASRYIASVGGDLDDGAEITAICGRQRRDDCTPRIKMPDGSTELITRDGRAFKRNGNRADFLLGTPSESGEMESFPLNVRGKLTPMDLTGYIRDPECGWARANHILQGDWDLDGDEDLFFVDFGPNQHACEAHYLEQQDDGSLVERFGRTPGLGPYPDYHMLYGISNAADVDGDGDEDILVSGNSYGDMHRLLLNDGSGHFTRFSGPWDNIERTYPGNNMRPQAIFYDFDSDGCQDIVVTESDADKPAVRAFRNQTCDQ